MQRVCDPNSGLFPTSKEISIQCSCPDWSDLCKHSAAVLCGVGVGLDEKPKLLFLLREANIHDLTKQTDKALTKKRKTKSSKKDLEGPQLADLFDLKIGQK